MNIINFHKYHNIYTLINEQKIYFTDNYLHNSYFIRLIGNGYNEYLFTLEYNKQIYKILFKEKHIMDWTIYSYNQSYIKFNGIGKDINTDTYHIFMSTDCDNFEYLNDKFKIIDICIYNNKPDKSLISISYDTEINELYNTIEINKLLKFPLDITNKIKIEYDELDKNKMYYFIINTHIITIIPIEITDINEKYISGFIYYNWNKIYVEKIEVELSNNNIDEYNIFINMTFIYNNINTEIYEYCYILG